MSGQHKMMAVLAGALGVGVVAVSLLGPLVLDVLRYRTSTTTLNQVTGGDLAGLVVVAPTALVAAVLLWRGHRAGPLVALAPALWAVYMYAQLIVGQEYLQLPGNNERFFPLLLGLFIVGEAVAVLAWRATDVQTLPPLPRRLDRIAGVVLLVVAAFLVVGLHLPSLVDAVADQPTAVEYTSSPTAFWIVKLMDLGIIVPAAVAIGVGLLRGAAWARKASYAILGGYTLLAAAVAGMAIVMYVNGDPDASLVNVAVFTAFAAGFGWLTVRLYRPLFAAARPRSEISHSRPWWTAGGIRR
jgi:hypothetical protein